MRIQPRQSTRKLDPFKIYYCGVIQRWAEAVWEGYPARRLLQKALGGARRRLETASSPWAVASDPVIVYLLTVARLGWVAKDPGVIIDDLGREIDMSRLPPAMVVQLAEEAAARASDREALAKIDQHCEDRLVYPLFWEKLRSLCDGKERKGLGAAAARSALARHFPFALEPGASSPP